MHGIDQRSHVIRVYLGMNPVSKIEHMPISNPKAPEHVTDLLPNSLRACIKHTRVQVALQRHLIAHALACHPEIDSPIDADCIAPALRHLLKPSTTTLGI